MPHGTPHPMNPATECLEPLSMLEWATKNMTINEIAQFSAALSLKRIADILTCPANKYGETFFEALATAVREER